MNSHLVIGFYADLEEAIEAIKSNTRLSNLKSYITVLEKFSLDKLILDADDIRDELGVDQDEREFIRGINKQLEQSPFKLKMANKQCELLYKPKATAFILLEVAPGTNQEVVEAINTYAKIANHKSIKIKEIAITMGGADIVVKVETNKSSEVLDAWIVNVFQQELRTRCFDKDTKNQFVKSTMTLRVMRDI